MATRIQWLNSWAKLRDKFEDAALEHPRIHLCLWNHLPTSVNMLEFPTVFRLSEKWTMESAGGETLPTEIDRQLAMGMPHVWCFRRFKDSSCVSCMLHEELARAAQRNGIWDASVDEEFIRAKSCDELFQTLATDCGHLIKSIPNDVPMKVAADIGVPYDYSAWVVMLFGLAQAHAAVTYADYSW